MTAPSSGFTRLQRSGPKSAAQVGCLFLLGGPLTLLGAGISSLFFLDRGGENAWVSLVVGAGFGGFGLLLLVAGIKGKRGLSVPETELLIEAGAALRPGVSARILVRQPGPARFDSLTVRLLCERIYRRRVREGSSAEVEDRERLVEQELLSLKDAVVPGGAPVEREVVLTIPPDARPDGPAVPDGTIRWTIEVIGDAGVLRATHHPFAISVAAPGAAAAVPHPDDEGGGAEPTISPPADGPRPRAGFLPARRDRSGGCLFLIMGLGFFFCGSTFSWLFFTAQTARGNPWFGLAAGIVFCLLGLAFIALGTMGGGRRRRR